MKTKLVLAIAMLYALAAYGTEKMSVRNEPHAQFVIPDTPSRDSFFELFRSTLEDEAPILFEDQLHPLQDAKRIMRHLYDSEGYRNSVNSAAVGALSLSLSYSAREAFLQTPIMDWLLERRDTFATLLKNSIGSVEEEEVRTVDASYRPSAERWWKRLSENGLRYGVRPFQTDPYLFVGYALGPREEPVAFVNTRYYPAHLSEQHADVSVSFQGLPNTTLDVGASFRFGNHERASAALRLTRIVGTHGVFFVSAKMGQETSCFAGFSMPM